MPQAPRKSAARWAELVGEFQQGDETEREFCQRHGFLLSTFRKWRYRYNRTAPTAAPGRQRSAFVKVTRSATTGSAPIVVRIGNAITLECPATLDMESIAQLARAVHHGR
ncbi:MAG: IS66 family insertion sequence element accessory protein TnpA [Gammaproteobacteria bacterium]